MRVWGDPVSYKSINIYPITMGSCMDFYETVNCLLYHKNRLQDVQILKMSYLQFLFVVAHSDPTVLSKLEKLLSMVLRDQPYRFTYENESIGLLVNDNILIDGNDFDEIKSIILEQNLIDYDESILDPDMERELQEAEQFMLNKNGTPATLEERIIALHCLSGTSFDVIRTYTIFQFNKTLERFSIIKNFDVYSSLMAEHGNSKDVQHWLSHIEDKERYSSVKMSESEFNKMTSDKGIFKS